MSPDREQCLGERAALVTPSDSTDLTTPAYIRVGTSGNIKITTLGGDTLLLTNIQAGEVLPAKVKRVWSTTTTATNISAHWNDQ